MNIDNLIEFIKQYTGDNVLYAEIFLIIFSALLIDLMQKIVMRHITRHSLKTRNMWDDALLSAIRAPLSVLIWLLGITIAASVAGLKYSEIVQQLGIIYVVSWSLVRFINYTEERILSDNEEAGKRLDRTTADAITQILKISVIITAILVSLQSMGVNISAVLAFGGVGGVAVGFAAKDLLANFFGALMLYLDRPFAIGDWIRSPDRDIEGTVEKIGWRLTIIRTFDKRPLYVPNAIFSNIAVQNPSRMTNRRIYETIGVRYQDAKHLPAIVSDIRVMLEQHEEIDQKQTLMVNFNNFASSSLDFFIYTFTRTTNWQKYHEIKQDVLFKINTIIEQHGAEIAFPTSTIQLENMTTSGASI